MIRSMTGFGRTVSGARGGAITVEIKTVNHKFFDETIKLPEGLTSFEDRIKELLQKRIRRGKVYFALYYDGPLGRPERVIVDKAAAKRYYDALVALNRHLGIRAEIGMKDLLALPGVITAETGESRFYAQLWPKIRAATEAALAALVADREKEGRALCRDLKKRSKRIVKLVGAVKAGSHINIENYRKRFADRIQELTSGREIDRGRLEIEVAIYAKSSDIAEEITRLRSHLANFVTTISGDGEVGKKLDFIAQELHREANTIGSKATDVRIAHHVIEIKGEIERIREQAKNLE